MNEAVSVERIDCPLCAGTDSRPWGEENGFSAVKCTACALVYVNPRPRLDDIAEATRLGEHRTPEGQLGVTFRRSDAKTVHYRRLLGRLLKDELPDTPMRWLDIGAGYGEVMEALQTILPPGSQVRGIEPMEPKAQAARRRALHVDARSLSEIGERFDGISLINVISHLPDPQAFLGEVAGLLKPGGMLLCETGNGGDLPDASDYPDRLDLPDHLIFAGVDNCCTFFERAGLTVTASAAYPRDTPGWVLKNVVKALLGRRVKLTMPLRSRFRTVFFIARLPEQRAGVAARPCAQSATLARSVSAAGDDAIESPRR